MIEEGENRIQIEPTSSGECSEFAGGVTATMPCVLHSAVVGSVNVLFVSS